MSDLTAAQEVAQMQAKLVEARWMEVEAKLAAAMAKVAAEVKQ